VTLSLQHVVSNYWTELSDLQINQRAAESLADPEEYPNLFPDWESALAAESELQESRSKYAPASMYPTYGSVEAEALTEQIQDLDINGDEPAENGGDAIEDREYVEEVQDQEVDAAEEQEVDAAEEQVPEVEGENVEEATTVEEEAWGGEEEAHEAAE